MNHQPRMAWIVRWGAIFLIVPLSACGSGTAKSDPPADPSGKKVAKKYPKAKEQYPYVVKITDFYGSQGYALEYYVDREKIVVVLWDDFGSDNKEILNKPLSGSEIEKWNAYWSAFKAEDLKDSYVDPNVADGLQMDFVFRMEGMGKSVKVQNVRVEKLEELAKEINAMLPGKLWMGRGDNSVVFPKKE